MKKRNKKQVEISGENRRDLDRDPKKYFSEIDMNGQRSMVIPDSPEITWNETIKSDKFCSFQDVAREKTIIGKHYVHSRTNNQSEYTDQNNKIEDVLTKREQQIVMIASTGLSNKQIAAQLQISAWTVSTHLRRIFTKLNVDNRTAMAYRCAKLSHK